MAQSGLDVEKNIEILAKSRLFDVDYYLTKNEDVKASGMDPIYHYVVAGENEGRKPCRLFDPVWYKSKNSIQVEGISLFVHYLAKGDKLGLKPSALFDPKFVRDKYQIGDKDIALIYFLAKHQSEQIDPHAYFSTHDYLLSYPDVVGSSLMPYYHFIEYGIFEGRQPRKDLLWSFIKNAYGLAGNNLDVYATFCAYASELGWKGTGSLPIEAFQEEVKRNHQPGEFYEPTQTPIPQLNKSNVDVFAFYLPQFHKDADNDRWWGEGFTEWTNLSRGLPRYKGHYQPRVPADLGFYDLSNLEILKRQANMARNAGITGFGLYYYNFGQKTVLRKPLEILRDNRSIDIKYFLIWANETWSRRWDGSEQDVLAAQEYPEGFEENLAEDFARFFADDRYYTIDGKPLIVVYRPGHIPGANDFFVRLRASLEARGYSAAIFMAQSFGDIDPRKYALDGALEFPPHKLGSNAHLINGHKELYSFSQELRIYSYDEFVSLSLNEQPQEYRLIKTAFPSWDNDARKQGHSNVLDGASPAKFYAWLKELVSKELRRKSSSPLVCINAWNEWGEGAYLEPDRHLGFANLNAVARALVAEFINVKKNVLLVGHDLFAGGAQRLLHHIGTHLKTIGYEVVFAVVNKRVDEQMFQEYKKVGQVYFLDEIASLNSWNEFHDELNRRTIEFAIFNTSVSAHWYSAFPASATAKSTLLVHEMSGMLRLHCNAEKLLESSSKINSTVFPSTVVRQNFEQFINWNLPSSTILQQGIGKLEKDLVPDADNDERFKNFVGGERRPLVIAGVGFADLRKGFDLFVQTCAELVRRGVDVLFVWQGAIHIDFQRWILNDLERLISSRNLVLAGENENVGNLLSKADAFFLSSREDPFPSVALEALLFGLPIFVFENCGGIAELVSENPRLGVVIDHLSVVSAAEQFEKVRANSRRNGIGSRASDKKYRSDFAKQHFQFEKYVQSLLGTIGVITEVDACILTYNHGKYVHERISSVVNQTSQLRSVTVVDAGSDDDTISKVLDFNKNNGVNVKIRRLKKNGGILPVLWLDAVRNSTAEYVWLAEGDDAARPGLVARCLDILNRDKTIGFAFTGIERVDETGRPLDHSLEQYVAGILGPSWATGGVFEGEDFLNNGAAVANPITNLGAVLWRREALVAALESPAFSNVLHFAYDWVLYVVVASAGWKIAYLPQAYAIHRIHSESFSGKKSVEEHVGEIERVYKVIDSVFLASDSTRRRAYIDSLSLQ